MTLYDKFVKITRDYLGFAAELFVDRILRSMEKNKTKLTRKDIPAFASSIELVAGTSLAPETKEEFKKRILRLR